MNKLVAATIIIIAAVILESCEPAATFDKPQPENVKFLATFPERFQGQYVAADEASVLAVTDKLITRHYDFDVKEHKDSLGSSYKLAGDTLIDQENGTKEKVLVKGDTVILHANWIDTLFNISADDVLKKFKGYYFLNSRYSEGAWEVKKLSLKKGVLTVGHIFSKEDIQKLKEITEASADTTSTHFTLTPRQFRRFIIQDGFAEQEIFTRMTGNGR